jgi:hypothetical protein
MVRLMPPAYARPYVKRHKNDAADAEAICEAVSRANMRFGATKTPEQQSCLMKPAAACVLITTLGGTNGPSSHRNADGFPAPQQDRGRLSAARREVPPNRVHGLSGKRANPAAGDGANLGPYSRADRTRSHRRLREYALANAQIIQFAPYLARKREQETERLLPIVEGDIRAWVAAMIEWSARAVLVAQARPPSESETRLNRNGR